MSVDATPTDDARGPVPEIMAAVDRSDATTRFLIADVGRDEAWLSMRFADAPTLDEWR